MFSSAMNALLKSHSERIIVKESMCNPCLRTTVTHVPGLYRGQGEGFDYDIGQTSEGFLGKRASNKWAV